MQYFFVKYIETITFVLFVYYNLYNNCTCENGLPINGVIFWLRYLSETTKKDKQNALRRECTFKIDLVLEIGVAGVNIYLKITVLTLSDVLARLAQSV